jgi:hypothetical protein
LKRPHKERVLAAHDRQSLVDWRASNEQVIEDVLSRYEYAADSTKDEHGITGWFLFESNAAAAAAHDEIKKRVSQPGVELACFDDVVYVDTTV